MGTFVDGVNLQTLQNRAVLQVGIIRLLTENKDGLTARELQTALKVQRKRLFAMLKKLRNEGKIKKFSEKRIAKDNARRIQTIFALNQLP